MLNIWSVSPVFMSLKGKIQIFTVITHDSTQQRWKRKEDLVRGDESCAQRRDGFGEEQCHFMHCQRKTKLIICINSGNTDRVSGMIISELIVFC